MQMWNHVCALRHFSLSLIKKFLQLLERARGRGLMDVRRELLVQLRVCLIFAAQKENEENEKQLQNPNHRPLLGATTLLKPQMFSLRSLLHR